MKIHGRKYIFFQPADTAMTPNGEIYFPPGVYKPDYATEITDTAWLLHELTHVWQYQHGVWVRLQGILARGKYAYGDLAGNTAPYGSFNIEQQAAIVQDYYLTTNGHGAYYGQGARADYERVLPFVPGKR